MTDAPQTLAQAADAMLADLALSPLTKDTYRYGLHAFIRCLCGNHGEEGEGCVAWIDEESLALFARWLRAEYPDPRMRGETSAPTRTARTYMAAARRLINWLDLRNLLPEGVSYDRMVRRIDAGRGHRRQWYQRRAVDPEVMRVLTYYLRQELPTRGPRRLQLLRNRALMALLYDTGMRIGEALALSREDVLDGRATKVRLAETKNGRPRTVFLSDETRDLLGDYLRERGHKQSYDNVFSPLFPSHGRGRSDNTTGRAEAISANQAWRIVKRAAIAEGLYDNTSPHSLRHRRAQDLLDAGMALEWVAALLGHEHPDTTRVVYAWETDEERLGDLMATYGKRPTEAAQSDSGSRY